MGIDFRQSIISGTGKMDGVGGAHVNCPWQFCVDPAQSGDHSIRQGQPPEGAVATVILELFQEIAQFSLADGTRYLRWKADTDSALPWRHQAKWSVAASARTGCQPGSST